MQPGPSGTLPELWIQPPVPSGGPVGSSARWTLPSGSRMRIGEVAGAGVGQPALAGVVHGVDAGGDLGGVDLGGEAVEELDDLVRRQVEPGVGPYGRAQLAHHGGGAHPAPHDVADDEGGAAGAEGDDVVPVAADGGVGAAGLVGGGDAEVVGLLEFLGQQAALEGDGGLVQAAFALAQPFGGLDLVGDVGGEDEDAAPLGIGVVGLDRGAGEGEVTLTGEGGGRRPRLTLRAFDGAGLAAAVDLVHEREQAEFVEFGQGVAGGGAGRAGAEDLGVGVVDEVDAVGGRRG